jgi:hypothetical protein
MTGRTKRVGGGMRGTTSRELLRRFVVLTVVLVAVWSLLLSLITPWWTDVVGGDLRPIFLIVGLPLMVAWMIYLIEDSASRKLPR